MVKDLLDNHKLTGRTKRSIIDLLGEADLIDSVEGNVSYQVLLDFGWDIDPVHTKYLVFQFDEDSVVTRAELLEWKK